MFAKIMCPWCEEFIADIRLQCLIEQRRDICQACGTEFEYELETKVVMRARSISRWRPDEREVEVAIP